MNLKSKRLEALHPGIRCLGPVEVLQVDLESLSEAVGGVTLDADFGLFDAGVRVGDEGTGGV
jgi:hypothetical protein